MASVAKVVTDWVVGKTGELRFPSLFLLMAGLFLFDLLVPDFLPIVDEVLLGLATLLLGRWRRRKRSPSNPDRLARSGRDGD